MRERPILFSAPMVRALLAGTKTQTRRIVKPAGWNPESNEYAGLTAIKAHGDPRIGLQAYFWHPESATSHGVRCPYGQPGDRLWVKETTLKVEDHGWIGPVYAESEQGRFALDWGYGEPDDPDHIPPHAIKCRPSLFMKRAMSRITLEVTGVRVERLHDISDADAQAEGVDMQPRLAGYTKDAGCKWEPANPVEVFCNLWGSINGPGSWDANPWVWVVEFRRTQEGKKP